MIYCRTCILPSTRPGTLIDETGDCQPCRNKRLFKELTDWSQRRQEFKALTASVKEKTSRYDCLIPVSGGKDSTWQVVTCLEHGMVPLAVTWKTPGRTRIGQKNLDNLVSLGVDHIDYQINPSVEKRFMLESLIKYGSPAVPMHLAMFAIPLNIAYRFEIPLVIWGENSAIEYGSDGDNIKPDRLTEDWLVLHGNTFGTKASDWVSKDFSEKDLAAYFGPSAEMLAAHSILPVFLGYYFQWDPVKTYEVALRNGFEGSKSGAKTGLYSFADIDDNFISVHHYLKWYKFGCTRMFDNLSIEIRNGRITRDEAIEVLIATGEQRPDADIEELCRFMDITLRYFYEIIEPFRNRDIWERHNGIWEIKNFIARDWNWR